MTENELIKKTLNTSKTIAMVGVSSIKKEMSSNIKRRPSTIVMKYMQEFGYRVIPVNPFSAGEKIYGETVTARLADIQIPIDIVDVFRRSKETPEIAKEAVGIGAKVFWLQYGIENDEAKIVFVGGVDDYSEIGMVNFNKMGATADSNNEFATCREPREHSRPTTSSRNGFVESQGASVHINECGITCKG